MSLPGEACQRCNCVASKGQINVSFVEAKLSPSRLFSRYCNYVASRGRINVSFCGVIVLAILLPIVGRRNKYDLHNIQKLGRITID